MEAVEGDGACRWLFDDRNKTEEYKGKCIMKNIFNADTSFCLDTCDIMVSVDVKYTCSSQSRCCCTWLTFLPLLFVHFLGLEIGNPDEENIGFLHNGTSDSSLNSIVLTRGLIETAFPGIGPGRTGSRFGWRRRRVERLNQPQVRSVDPFWLDWWVGLTWGAGWLFLACNSGCIAQ
jgi:hypothetical protein